jgi:hypothetical protein
MSYSTEFPGRPVLTVLPRLFCPCYSIPAVPTLLICSLQSVLSALSQLSCPAGLFWPFCTICPSRVNYLNCQVRCSGFPVKISSPTRWSPALLSPVFFPCSHILIVLSCVPCPVPEIPHVQAVLSRQSCSCFPDLSFRGCP